MAAWLAPGTAPKQASKSKRSLTKGPPHRSGPCVPTLLGPALFYADMHSMSRIVTSTYRYKRPAGRKSRSRWRCQWSSPPKKEPPPGSEEGGG
jgi:hypothetical protein